MTPGTEAAALRPARKLLLEATPDIPRWLEVRSLLLCRDSEIFGGDTCNGVVAHPSARLIGIVGAPAAEELSRAVARCGGDAVVVTDPAQFEFVTGTLSGYFVRRAWRFVFRHDSLRPRSARGTAVRPIRGAEIEAIPDLRNDLRASLLRAAGIAGVVAAFVSGRPVSFGSVNWETETLCDLFAETLPAYRGRGYAEDCLYRMVRESRFRGKVAAGTVEWNNPQSLALVSKLGATRIGECFLIDTVGSAA